MIAAHDRAKLTGAARIEIQQRDDGFVARALHRGRDQHLCIGVLLHHGAQARVRLAHAIDRHLHRGQVERRARGDLHRTQILQRSEHDRIERGSQLAFVVGAGRREDHHAHRLVGARGRRRCDSQQRQNPSEPEQGL